MSCHAMVGALHAGARLCAKHVVCVCVCALDCTRCVPAGSVLRELSECGCCDDGLFCFGLLSGSL
jgi:hypothetical protein